MVASRSLRGLRVKRWSMGTGSTHCYCSQREGVRNELFVEHDPSDGGALKRSRSLDRVLPRSAWGTLHREVRSSRPAILPLWDHARLAEENAPRGKPFFPVH